MSKKGKLDQNKIRPKNSIKQFKFISTEKYTEITIKNRLIAKKKLDQKTPSSIFVQERGSKT